MAKPASITPDQESSIRRKLGMADDADLTGVYDMMSEEGVMRLAEPVAAAPVIPTAPKPVAVPKPVSTPAPTPVARPTLTIPLAKDETGRITTEAQARSRSGFNAQIQPEGMAPRFTAATASTGQEAIDKALEQRRKDIVARSYTGAPETRLTPEAGAAEMERGRRIAVEPRTATGETRPLTPLASTIKDIVGDNIISDIYGGIAPQVIETPEQNRQRNDAAYREAQDFFKSLGRPATGDEFKKVYESFRYYGGKRPEGFVPQVMKGTGADKLARAAFTTTAPTGMVIESPIATAGKVLSAAESGLVAGAATTGQAIGAGLARAKGLPEEAIPEVSFRKNIREEIAKGAGLMGAGAESFEKAAKYAGADKDTQELVGFLGGTLGFVGGVGVPLDLGVVSGLSTGAKTASSVGKLAESFGETATLGTKAKSFLGGASEGALDAWRITSPKTGGLNTVSKEMEAATTKWLNSPSVNAATSTAVKLGADDLVQAAIKADKEAGTAASKAGGYDQAPYVDALRQRFDDIKAAEVAANTNHPITKYNSFDEWAEAAERHGIDVYNSAGKRAAVLGNPPPNVRIKELEDSVRTTRAGVPSVDYFDDLAAGGRQNLYFNAFIDSVDPALKSKLLAGGSVKSSEFLPALDEYVNAIRREVLRAGKTPQQVAQILQGLESALTRKGIKLAAGRITGAAEAAVAAPSQLTGGLISTPKIQSALEKAYKIDLGRRLANDIAGRTGITGKTVRLGNLVLSPTDAKDVLAKVDSNATLKSLRERFIKNNGQAIDLTDAEIASLRKYFVEPFKKEKTLVTTKATRGIQKPEVGIYLKPTETYSPFTTAPTIMRVEKTGQLSAQQFNELVQSAISLEASTKMSAKSTQDIATISSRLASEPTTAAEHSYFVRNVMTPADLKETGLAAILVDTSKKVLDAPPTKNPIANKIIGEVNDRMGSLGDRFKAKMRAKMSQGLDRPTAFAQTMVEEWTQEGIYKPMQGVEILPSGAVRADVAIQKPFEAARAGEPLTLMEAGFKEKMGAYEMYRSYIASIYGGYEQAIDAIATTGRTLELDKMAIATKEMRDLITVLMHAEGTIFNKNFILFQQMIERGDSIAALNILQRTHIELSGYSIQQALTRLSGVNEASIPALLRTATENARNGTISSVAGKAGRNYLGNENINFFSGKFSRGIDESYKAASQQAPLFKPENYKEMLVGNYYLRGQANVIDDVLAKSQTAHPELFPSATVLTQLAKDDWSVVRSGLVKNLDYRVTLPAGTAGSLTQNQIAAYQLLRPALIGETGVTRLATGGKILAPARDIKLAQDLLIAGVQDNVSLISGGRGVSKNYLEVLATHFQDDTVIAGLDAQSRTAIRQVLASGLESLESKPASVYTSIFDSQARADATALFYQTSLTNIKNQLKNPFSASIQGVGEKVGTIPLLQQAQAGIKRPLLKAANIKATTDTIQALQLSTSTTKLDQYVAADGIRLSKQIEDAERVVDGIIASELSPEVMALAKKKEMVLDDLAKQSGDVQYRRVVLDTLGTIYDNTLNIAKNGLLGGLVLPNLNYAVVNALTAPYIISTTVGLRNAASIFESGVTDVMRFAYSKGATGRVGWKLPASKVLITAPDGTIYTTEMLARLVNEGAIGKSQATAELTDKLVGSTIDWAGRTGLYGDKNIAIKTMRREFFNYQDLNMFSTAANAVDQTFRMSVVMKALREGETLDNALRLGKESLFDYGNMTQIEESIAKTIWFYRFRRNNYRSIFTSLATDPKGLKAAFASNKGFQYVYDFAEKELGVDKEDIDIRYVLKDYSESRILLDLIEDPENKKRYAVYGAPIPALQGVAEMTDYAAMFLTPYVLAARGQKGLGKATAETFIEVPSQIFLENANPVLQTVGIAATGMDIRRGGQAASDYLDPKLMWYMQQNPEQWQTFSTLFNIEEVPFEEERPSVGYYNGRQWRIKKGDKTATKNWNLWQSALLSIGVGRTMRDYATIWANTGYAGEVISAAAGTAATAGAVPLRLPKEAAGKKSLPVTLDTDSAGIDFWRAAGVITVQDAPLLEEVQRANRLKAAGEIKSTAVQQQEKE